jgi:hypothetical protein
MQLQTHYSSFLAFFDAALQEIPSCQGLLQWKHIWPLQLGHISMGKCFCVGDPINGVSHPGLKQSENESNCMLMWNSQQKKMKDAFCFIIGILCCVVLCYCNMLCARLDFFFCFFWILTWDTIDNWDLYAEMPRTRAVGIGWILLVSRTTWCLPLRNGAHSDQCSPTRLFRSAEHWSLHSYWHTKPQLWKLQIWLVMKVFR